MIVRKITILSVSLISFFNSKSQVFKWDDTLSKNWSSEFRIAQVISSYDSAAQPLVFYKSKSKTPQPLIVSLHSWSGDYQQTDSIAAEIVERDWNYVHPHFRGANNHPLSCGSNAAVQDIEDAIRFMLKMGGIDSNDIHIMGGSGGGYMTLVCYHKLKRTIKSFQAWVAISDLEAWYHESLSRTPRYSQDILKCTGDTLSLNIAEARRRSPLYMDFLNTRRKTPLLIAAGVHDGYQGSVPITHSIKMYNKILKDMGVKNPQEMVSDKDMLELVVKRHFPNRDAGLWCGYRKVHFFRRFDETVSLMLFEGKHEQLVKYTLGFINKDKKKMFAEGGVLVLGDSNAANDSKNNTEGWAEYLQRELPFMKIYNFSKPGNTLGFDNNNDKKLNTLANIQQNLDSVFIKNNNKPLHTIVIALGTNDCKVDFKDRQTDVLSHLEQIINSVKKHRAYVPTTRIIYLTPPPMATDDKLQAKYHGGDARIRHLIEKIPPLSSRLSFQVVNSYALLQSDFEQLNTDGVHLNRTGKRRLATYLAKHILNVF
jgi:lysophospholipase L1-like esterase